MSGDSESWYSRLRNLILNANIGNPSSDSVFSTLPEVSTSISLNDVSILNYFTTIFPNLNLRRIICPGLQGTDHLSPPYGSPHVSISGEFLETGNRSGWLALHEAAARNDSEVLAFLLKHAGTFIDVLTEENETPLFLAVKHGHLAVAKQLIKAHSSLNIANIDGLTALSVG